MPSSAYASPQRHSPSLPLNGKVQSGAPNSSPPGHPHKGVRTPQPSLGKPWLLTWTHSIWKSMDVGFYNTGMTCSAQTSAAGCRDQGKMLERDQSAAPAADGSRLLGVEEGTDL
ncbi:unnamed protein product [Rangifer tarandus platyrhynchus]|uniref:Uncharacterized protein n=2 Tax=Rangifer tarandus platyrhynchus TaxID=3082113 RepID=A0AC59YTV5_RANTA|nr:unnamed protein product [Rangifer tarandus platyrhynchus]